MENVTIPCDFVYGCACGDKCKQSCKYYKIKKEHEKAFKQHSSLREVKYEA